MFAGDDMLKRESWDQYFLGLAKKIGQRSKDPSVRIGAIVVDPDKNIRCSGYNGLPRKVNDLILERWERPKKYSFMAHSEKNCICAAARMGVSTNGCTMYVCSNEYCLPPCADCAQAIIQAGIVRVVYTTSDNIPERWRESVEIASIMFKEAGVETIAIKKTSKKAS